MRPSWTRLRGLRLDSACSAWTSSSSTAHRPKVLVDKSPTFEALRRLKDEGRILHWGVSVETVDEVMLAIAQPDCATIQIIFNMLRTKPSKLFLPAAKAADVGTLIRLPLASGLLTGKVDATYIGSLDAGDHRKFNVAGRRSIRQG